MLGNKNYTHTSITYIFRDIRQDGDTHETRRQEQDFAEEGDGCRKGKS